MFEIKRVIVGQDRLIEAVRAAAELPASQIVQEVARLISDFTAAALDPKDDLTLVVLRRDAEVALDWITGESDRVPFRPGDTVPAGAFNPSA